MPMLPIEINESDRIAIVAPHPDDEVIGAGGLLLSHPSQCTVILMTDGRYGDPNVESETLRTRRYDEFTTVIRGLGANSISLNYRDGTLLGEPQCFAQVELKHYTKIFLPCADDDHPDHMAACIYAKEKILEQNSPNVEVYEYEVHLPLHKTSHYIDITELYQKKKELVSIYRSQMKIHDYPNQVCSLAAYRGFQNNQNGRYLEAYQKVVLSVKLMDQRDVDREKRIEKATRINRLLSKWLDISIRGENVGKFLHENGFRYIVIYGWGEIGKKLYRELLAHDIQTAYVLDKNVTQSEIKGLEIYEPHKKQGENVDAVIVTVAGEFEEIRNYLEHMKYSNIYSLENVLEKINLFSEERGKK